MPTDDPRSTAKIGITAGARLHFGLLDTAAPFGGLGVMIANPQTQIAISPADQFQCSGDGADRVIEIANRLKKYLGFNELPACDLEILQRPPAHTGLGTGTQLAMAVADGLAKFCGADIPDAILALQIAGRGKRSAVGVHGYLHGGLIYEASDSAATDSTTGNATSPVELNPIVQRIELPEQWTVALARPAQPADVVFGIDEQQQFAQLSAATFKQTGALKAVIVDRLIPAAQSSDFQSFADAVHHYNHQSGMLFHSVQGGAYNGPQVTQTIELLQQHGAQGIGQSSWGPSVFSWFATKRDAENFVASLPVDSLIIDIVGVKNGSAQLSS